MSKTSESQSLEEYLSQIARELRALPSSARDDEMREIEAHLRAMIEQRGDVATALAQFGAPRKVGRDLRRAWERKQPEAWARATFALLTGLLILWSSGLVTQEFTTLYLAFHNISKESLNHTIAPQVWPTIMKVIYYQSAIGFLLFFIVGYAAKIISPKRGFVATLPILAIPVLREIFFWFPDGYDNLFGLIFRALLSFILLSIGAYSGKHHNRRIRARS